MRRLAIGLFAVLAALLGESRALACAACGAGDPTLTVMGDEKTFAGRFRAALELRTGDVGVGAPGSAFEVAELRTELAVAYAPTSTTLILLGLPLLARHESFADGRDAKVVTVGDLDLRVKQFVWSGRRGLFQHQIAIQGGVKAPTGPTEDDDRGVPLPAVLQPGSGSVVPYAGVFYGMTRAPWSLYASVTLSLPYSVRSTAHTSDSLRGSVSVQEQVGRRFAARLGIDTRLDASAELDGAPDPNSGGFVGYVSPAIVVSPASDLLLTAGVFAPVVQLFQGFHREATIVTLGATYDF